MLKGRFGDTSGRPYIEGHILLPRLKKRGNVSFVFDTGADTQGTPTCDIPDPERADTQGTPTCDIPDPERRGDPLGRPHA